MIALITKKQFLIVVGVLLLLVLAATMRADHELKSISGYGIVDHQLSFNKEQAVVITQLWNQVGRSQFDELMLFDSVLPVIYAVFLAGLLLNWYQNIQTRSSRWWSIFLFMPFLMMFFDYTENAYQMAQMDDLGVLPDWYFTMTSVISCLKWLCLVVVIFTLILLRARMRTAHESR